MISGGERCDSCNGRGFHKIGGMMRKTCNVCGGVGIIPYPPGYKFPLKKTEEQKEKDAKESLDSLEGMSMEAAKKKIASMSSSELKRMSAQAEKAAPKKRGRPKKVK